jgi:hypothetical protein
MTETITAKLDQLADLQAGIDACRLQYQEQRDAILTAEIRARLDEIDSREKADTAELEAEALVLTAEIKAEVLAAGKGEYKGAHLQAVWSRGRVSWDDKQLAGYAAAHPEILPFRKEGAPSVAIKAVGK